MAPLAYFTTEERALKWALQNHADVSFVVARVIEQKPINLRRF
jgi:hypothetical protein